MRRKDMHVSDVMVAVHGGCDGSVSRQWRRSWCRRCDTGCSGNGNCERCGDGLLLAYVSQISRPVEASQALVSSSRLTIPSLPDGGRCCGQTSKMWSTVCSGAPHSQTEESLRPHFSMDELNRPTPGGYRHPVMVMKVDALNLVVKFVVLVFL